MSRCFPYRPQAYESNEFVGEALIESIKNVKKSKNDRKKGRKLEKERRKEHKHTKQVSGCITIDQSKKIDDEKYSKSIKSNSNEKLDFRPKGNKDEAEQSEKSDITVEHEQPACSGSVFFASDNLHNNRKRKITDSTTPASRVDETRKTGIRIHFSLKKHSKASVFFNTVVSDSSANIDDRIADRVKIDGDLSRKDKICSTNPESHIAGHQAPTSLTLGDSGSSTENSEKSFRNIIQRVKSPYMTLIEDWISPSVQFDQGQAEDDDWLFASERRQLHSCKKHKSDKIPCYRNSSLWPQAPYLHGAELFAFPYTVPF